MSKTSKETNYKAKIPKNQTIVLEYIKNGSTVYVITQNNTGETFTLFYVDSDGCLIKIKTGNSPLKFKECYPN